MYAIGAKRLENQISSTHMEIAEGLAHTCHESYARTPTGLGPESFRFTEGIEARALKSSEKYYILRPEAIESWFYMWRFTKDPKYREWAWNAVLVSAVLTLLVIGKAAVILVASRFEENHCNPSDRMNFSVIDFWKNCPVLPSSSYCVLSLPSFSPSLQ